MPPVTGARVMRNASVMIDATEYANQLSKARLVPDQPVQTRRTLVPDGAVSDVDSPVWTLELAGLQINKPDGLAAAFRAANGTVLEVVLVPHTGPGEAQATCQVLALHVPFGGDQGNWLETGDVTLPVVGQPVFGTVAGA